MGYIGHRRQRNNDTVAHKVEKQPCYRVTARHYQLILDEAVQILSPDGIVSLSEQRKVRLVVLAVISSSLA